MSREPFTAWVRKTARASRNDLVGALYASLAGVVTLALFVYGVTVL